MMEETTPQAIPAVGPDDALRRIPVVPIDFPFTVTPDGIHVDYLPFTFTPDGGIHDELVVRVTPQPTQRSTEDVLDV